MHHDIVGPQLHAEIWCVINNISVAGMWVVTNAITMIAKDVEVKYITWYGLVKVIVNAGIIHGYHGGRSISSLCSWLYGVIV